MYKPPSLLEELKRDQPMTSAGRGEDEPAILLLEEVKMNQQSTSAGQRGFLDSRVSWAARFSGQQGFLDSEVSWTARFSEVS